MTTEAQIIEQLERDDIQPYLNGAYQGTVPETFVEQFRIAMMLLPPASHKYSMSDVKVMSQRRPDEVTVRELGMMINVVYAIAFVSMYETLEEGIEKTMLFDKMKDEYNKSTAAFERKVQAKRQRLLKLSGVGGNTASFNGIHSS